MKNTLILLVLFLALAGGAFYYLNGNDSKNTVSESDRNFAVKDIETVHKIFLADRSGKTITLVKKAKKEWEVNGKFRASQNVVENLLTTIKRLRMQSIPPQAARKNIISDIAVHGIKVELYNKADNKLKSYYVGGMTNEEKGTYMIMDGANLPYIMEIPGFEGGLRVRFWKPDEDYWKDLAVFREDIDKIKSPGFNTALYIAKFA